MKILTPLSLAVLVVLSSSVYADTPANCTYDDVQGRWLFMMGPTGGDRTINCTDPGKKPFCKLLVLSHV